MVGNARLQVKVELSDLQTNAKNGETVFGTTSTAMEGILGGITSRQIEAVSDSVVAFLQETAARPYFMTQIKLERKFPGKVAERLFPGTPWEQNPAQTVLFLHNLQQSSTIYFVSEKPKKTLGISNQASSFNNPILL
jgi:hypothetical protein